MAALADGVRDDLQAISDALGTTKDAIERLGESAKAINGLSGSCAGWADHLGTLLAEVQKEQREIPAKLLGRPIREITEHVNQEHAEKVLEARK